MRRLGETRSDAQMKLNEAAEYRISAKAAS
jgi:hypothetical protein